MKTKDKNKTKENTGRNGRKTAVRSIALTGIVAALYATLTVALAPISYGPLQFRVSESMTLLPLLFPEAVAGLTIGCLAANIFSAYGWADVVFGTSATLIASVLTRVIAVQMIGRRKNKYVLPFIGGIPPIVVNALILPIIWLIFAGDKAYFMNMIMIFGTQAAVIYAIGVPLYFGLKKTNLFPETDIKTVCPKGGGQCTGASPVEDNNDKPGDIF